MSRDDETPRIEVASHEDGQVRVRIGGNPANGFLCALHLAVEADEPPPVPVLRILAVDYGRGEVESLPHGHIVNLTVSLPVRVEVVSEAYTSEDDWQAFRAQFLSSTNETQSV